MNTNNNDVLSTRQVAQLLGVGEATVKRWADAGEIDCFRTPGGHRKFRLRDVTNFVQSKEFDTRGVLPDGVPLGADRLGDAAVAHFEARALAGDTPAIVAQLSALRLRGHDLAEIFDEVAAPALVRIGAQWADHKLLVAEEHIATGAIVDAIARAQPLAEPPGEPVRADRGTAVVCAAAGELHDIGPRMVATLLRARGFEVLAPLAQTPARDLAELIVRARASLVAISATMPSPALQEQVDLAAQAARQAGGRVLVGGAASKNLQLPPGAQFAAKMADLIEIADQSGRRRARA